MRNQWILAALLVGGVLPAQRPTAPVPRPAPRPPQAIPVVPPPVDHPIYAGQPSRNDAGSKGSKSGSTTKGGKGAKPAPAGGPAAPGARPAKPKESAAAREAREFRDKIVEGRDLKRAVKSVNELKWHEDFSDAAAQSAATGKPVFWVNALGEIDGFA